MLKVQYHIIVESRDYSNVYREYFNIMYIDKHLKGYVVGQFGVGKKFVRGSGKKNEIRNSVCDKDLATNKNKMANL